MISVVIPLYNDEKNIPLCLEALRSELHAEDEVIVVDNGSTDGSVEAVLRFQGMRVKVVNLETGTVAAVRNYGAGRASGDVFAFIDSDCLVLQGWRAAVSQRLNDDENIGASGSKCLVPKKSPWFVRVWFSQRRPDGDVVYINSGNFIVKKEAFKAVGGFNEALVTGEDAEVCLRLRQSGYRVVEDATIAVVHLGNPASLSAFYRQQKWHALGMFGTVHWLNLDKPFFMTVIFGICILFVSILLLMDGFGMFNMLAGVLLLIFVPLISSLYRCWCSKVWMYLPQFFILYVLYFFARLNVLLALLSRNGNAYQRRVK
jgi:glycosyltransferase involved in cell wall biosynthesis